MIYFLMFLVILALVIILVKMWGYYVAHSTDITGWEVKYLEQTGRLAWRYQLRDADGGKVLNPQAPSRHSANWFYANGPEKRAIRKARLRAAKIQRKWDTKQKRISGTKDIQF